MKEFKREKNRGERRWRRRNQKLRKCEGGEERREKIPRDNNVGSDDKL